MDYRNVTDYGALNRIVEKMKFCPECGKELVDFNEPGDILLKKICPDEHATFVWGADQTNEVALMVVTEDTVMLP